MLPARMRALLTALALALALLCPGRVDAVVCYSCGSGLCSSSFDASSTSQVYSVGSAGCATCYKAVDRSSQAITRYCVTSSTCPTIYNTDVYCCTDRLCNSAETPMSRISLLSVLGSTCWLMLLHRLL